MCIRDSTHPDPEFLNNGGTRFSTEAVHKTWVSPNLTKHDPSACFEIPASISIFLSSLRCLPDGLIISYLIFFNYMG